MQNSENKYFLQNPIYIKRKILMFKKSMLMLKIDQTKSFLHKHN